MHGTGVLRFKTSRWVVSDTHTSRAMLLKKDFCFICFEFRILQR